MPSDYVGQNLFQSCALAFGRRGATVASAYRERGVEQSPAANYQTREQREGYRDRRRAVRRRRERYWRSSVLDRTHNIRNQLEHITLYYIVLATEPRDQLERKAVE